MLGDRGDISLSIPMSSTLVLRDEFLAFIVRNNLLILSFNVASKPNSASDGGQAPPDRFRVFVSQDRMYKHLRAYERTVGTHGTPLEFIRRYMMSSLYGFHTHAPAMACITTHKQLPDEYSFRDQAFQASYQRCSGLWFCL